ncbi:unnamed protein product [Clonostachys solani]|uniref:Polyketide synthase n=1 Tax=Clonostachys solani TaxID=160281 RepID=A0A9N9ZJN9_9HYPO|nr:unnamed protein product [Clonostachys solani]
MNGQHQWEVPITSLAVVGISFRLPGGANNPEKLWEILSEGTDTWSPVPDDRFNERAFYHPSPDDPNGTTNHRGGHFIEANLRSFDTTFFRIAPQQAAYMDPQQRMLLELTYEALENAGLPREQYSGSNTGVFGALFITDFDRNVLKDTIGKSPYALLGQEEAMIANRISHSLDLQGPSLTLDTGCSGGMVALHQACSALRNGECETAVVASANLTLSPDHAAEMSSLHFLGGDGRCYPFDSRGSGYGRGEGHVVFVLKRLQDALDGRYPVRAIIRSTAVNQDGYTPGGITHPNRKAQEDIIRFAYSRAGLQPYDISYIEAHGTGTVAGDSEEMAAISSVFTGPGRSSPLYVGSIKGNIGHTENTSGLAGVLKSILVLDHEQIPPLTNFDIPKPGLPLDGICLPRTLKPLPRVPGIPLRVSVNSFGYGGTNGHAILEEAPDKNTIRPPDDSSLGSLPLLFQLSANCKESLLSLMEKYASWLGNHLQASLIDLSYTLRERRSALPCRFSCVAETHGELAQQLNNGLSGSKIQNASSNGGTVVYVFTGQGAQWLGMGRELLKTNGLASIFQKSIQASTEILLQLGATWNLETALLGTGPESDLLNTAELAQPVTTALQSMSAFHHVIFPIALISLLHSQGVKPDVVVGHSSGEVAAAYAAGYISHQVALTIAFHRGFMAQAAKQMDLPAGGMMSVGLGEEEAAKIIKSLSKGKVVIACINSPSNVTISGDALALDELSQILDDNGDGIFRRRLFVDTAYHSHHMMAVAENYRARLGTLGHMEPTSTSNQPRFVSSVTGATKSSGFGVEYWIDNLVSPVRFRDAIQTVATDLGFHRTSQRSPNVFFIEVGPHPALAGPVRHSLAEGGGVVPEFTYGSVLQRKMGAVTSALSLIGRLFERGFHVERTAVSDLVPEFATAKVSTDLPSYTWDHSVDYWKEPRHSSEHRFRRHPYHDLLGVHIPGSVSTEPQWRHSVSIETLPWLADHVIDGLIIFPGSGYICMALEGIRQLQNDRYPSQTLEFLVVRDVSFIRALVIPPTGQVELQLRLRPRATLGLDFSFSIAALSDGEWSENCTGCVEGLLIDELSSHREETTQAGQPELPKGQLVEVSQLYDGLRACGNTYGPSFAAIQSYILSADAQQSMAAVMIPDVAATMRAQYQEPHLIHPSTLDAILHTSLPVAQQSLGSGSIMPVHIDEFLVSTAPNLPTQPGSELQVNTKMLSSRFRTAHLDLVVTTNASRSPVLAISGVEVRKVGDGPEVNHDSRAAEEPETCYQVEWEADQDFLRVEDMEESPTLERLLGYISFKTPGLTILDMKPSKRPAEFSTLDVIEGHRGSVDLYDIFEHKPLPNGGLNNGHTNGGPWQIEDIRPSLHSPSYDVILITSLEWLEAASSILKPNGILISVISPSDEMTAVTSPYLQTQLTFEDTTLGQKIVMMRPVKASEDKNHSEEIQVICHSEGQSVSPWAKTLIDALPSYQINIQGAPTTLDSKAIQNSASGTPTLVIEDQPQAILSDPKYFGPATSLLRQPAQVVWVSSENDVRAHQTTGVIRTAHAENDSLRATTIYTEAEAPLDDRFHDLVAYSISKAGEKNREREYRMLKSGTVLVPRLRIHKGYTDAVRADSDKIFDVKNRSIEDLSHPVELCISSRGQKPGDACFAEQETSGANSMAQNDVQIAVDCMAVTGSYRSSHLGEYVGTIARVGSSVNGFVVGDRVVALGTTIGSSHPCVSQAHAVHLPNNLSSVKASALVMSAMTAIYCLRELANLSQGDTVLVHGVGTAVGKASIALARLIGVRVAIAVADNSEAVLLRQREVFSPDDIFIVRPSLTRRSAKELFGNGLDAIISAAEDPLPTEIPRLVKPGGSILIMTSSTHNTFATTLPVELPRNTTIHHCDLRSLLEARPKMIGSLLPQAVSLLSCISLDGLDILVREVSQTQEALKLLDSHAYPIAILQVKKDSLTPVKVMKRSTWQHENGSFVISGGLGELGQRFLQLLARYGAKFLVTLSRSLLPEDKLQKLESKLKAINPECRVYCIKCDITSKESVEEAARSIKDLGLYPIRGVIQSSTIIRDGTLETMSFEDYRSSFQIKADGSLHLYRAFSSTSLRFFILLSSIVGVVGTSGQANYNAGNVTQDIFSQIHGGDSCRFTSLDIGWVPNTHLVADYEVRKNSVRRAGLHPVLPQALYNFFDHTIAATATTERTSQVIIGIESKDAAQSIAVNGNVYSPLFCHVIHSATDVKKPSDGATQTFSEVVATGDFDLIVDFISRRFMAQLARLLYVDVSTIDRFLTSLLVLGVDSLVAIELRNWVQREFDASVQSSEIFTDQSVYTLSEKIATRSRAISNLEFQM